MQNLEWKNSLDHDFSLAAASLGLMFVGWNAEIYDNHLTPAMSEYRCHNSH